MRHSTKTTVMRLKSFQLHHALTANSK